MSDYTHICLIGYDGFIDGIHVTDIENSIIYYIRHVKTLKFFRNRNLLQFGEINLFTIRTERGNETSSALTKAGTIQSLLGRFYRLFLKKKDKN